MDKHKLIEELRNAVQLVKDSGSTEASKAFTARASAIAKRLNIIRMLNNEHNMRLQR